MIYVDQEAGEKWHEAVRASSLDCCRGARLVGRAAASATISDVEYIYVQRSGRGSGESFCWALALSARLMMRVSLRIAARGDRVYWADAVFETFVLMDTWKHACFARGKERLKIYTGFPRFLFEYFY